MGKPQGQGAGRAGGAGGAGGAARFRGICGARCFCPYGKTQSQGTKLGVSFLIQPNHRKNHRKTIGKWWFNGI